jgi:hypothetical protein
MLHLGPLALAFLAFDSAAFCARINLIEPVTAMTANKDGGARQEDRDLVRRFGQTCRREKEVIPGMGTIA